MRNEIDTEQIGGHLFQIVEYDYLKRERHTFGRCKINHGGNEMIRSWTGWIVVGLGLVVVAAPVSANMLVNGNMDRQPVFNNETGWEVFSNSDDPGTAIVWADWANGGGLSIFNFWSQEGDDDYGLAFACWQATSGGFYQDTQIQTDRTYTFTIWSHTGCNAIPGKFMQHGRRIDFEWYDGKPTDGGQIVATLPNDITSQIVNGQCDPGGPTDASNWQYFKFENLTPPVDAEWLRIVISWDSFGELAVGGSGAIRWDSARLAVSSLDPTNGSVAMSTDFPMWYLDIWTQNEVNYMLQLSTDLVNGGWMDAGAPLIIGNGEVQRAFHLPYQNALFIRFQLFNGNPLADNIIVAFGRTNTALISFDGQPGVQYSLEYSEAAPGGPWQPTGLEISGDGTRQTVADPAGPSETRDYHIQEVDPEFETPLF